jgi:hypothetical protein
MKDIWILLGFLSFASTSLAQQEADSEGSHIPHGPHHFSVLAGETHENGEGNNATLGIDYEYRINPLLGLGVIVEHAYGELDATTLLGVADFHVYEGFIVQVGTGFEHKESENIFVATLGFLYEIEYENFTLSPQVHWGYHEGEPNAVVAGIALGFSF